MNIEQRLSKLEETVGIKNNLRESGRPQWKDISPKNKNPERPKSGGRWKLGQDLLPNQLYQVSVSGKFTEEQLEEILQDYPALNRQWYSFKDERNISTALFKTRTPMTVVLRISKILNNLDIWNSTYLRDEDGHTM